jgi:hypothetical protein
VARHPQWRQRLGSFLTANQLRPFEWGEWDCCIGLARGSIMAVRGDDHDYFAAYEGQYCTREGAWLALRQIDGVRSPSALMDKCLGERHPPAMAHDGDLVLHRGAIGVLQRGRGVFIGTERIAPGASRQGLVSIPRAELRACWHV